MDIIEKIISNFKNNKSLYIGENVTISEHMIQSAMIAEKSKSKGFLICSCLLHDYGHFILDDPDELVRNNQDGKHIKLIIGSRVVNEGVTLENVKEVQLDVEILGPRAEIRLPGVLKGPRSRINCTMPAENGRWRWFGRQFLTN